MEPRKRQILGSFRRHQRRQLPEMRHQSPQTRQEEEDKARDQDPPKPVWRAQYRCAVRCSQRRSSRVSDLCDT